MLVKESRCTSFLRDRSELKPALWLSFVTFCKLNCCPLFGLIRVRPNGVETGPSACRVADECERVPMTAPYDVIVAKRYKGVPHNSAIAFIKSAKGLLHLYKLY